MFRKSVSLSLSLLLVFITQSALAADQSKKEKTLDGVKTQYAHVPHWSQKNDCTSTVRGGIAMTVGSSNHKTKLDSVSASYEVYSLIGGDEPVEQDSTSNSESTGVGLASEKYKYYYKSKGEAALVNGKATWEPSSTIYNPCDPENPTIAAKSLDGNRDDIENLIKQIEKAESVTSKSKTVSLESNKDSKKQLIATLFNDKEQRLSEFGIRLTDLNISQIDDYKNVKEFKDKITDIDFKLAKNSDLVKSVYLTPVKGEKNGVKYIITGYAFVDKTNQELDKGLIIEAINGDSDDEEPPKENLHLEKIPAKILNGVLVDFSKFEDKPKSGKYYYIKNNRWWYEKDFGGHQTSWKLKHSGSNEYWSFTASGKIIRYKSK